MVIKSKRPIERFKAFSMESPVLPIGATAHFLYNLYYHQGQYIGALMVQGPNNQLYIKSKLFIVYYAN